MFLYLNKKKEKNNLLGKLYGIVVIVVNILTINILELCNYQKFWDEYIFLTYIFLSINMS